MCLESFANFFLCLENFSNFYQLASLFLRYNKKCSFLNVMYMVKSSSTLVLVHHDARYIDILFFYMEMFLEELLPSIRGCTHIMGRFPTLSGRDGAMYCMAPTYI